MWFLVVELGSVDIVYFYYYGEFFWVVLFWSFFKFCGNGGLVICFLILLFLVKILLVYYGVFFC